EGGQGPHFRPQLYRSDTLSTPYSLSSTVLTANSSPDHMLTIEWNKETGWQAPHIVPYQNLSLDPATCVFHYAFECFEGMKAYKDKAGRIRLFRPDRNMARFNKSAARIALPNFDSAALTELSAQFTQ